MSSPNLGLIDPALQKKNQSNGNSSAKKNSRKGSQKRNANSRSITLEISKTVKKLNKQLLTLYNKLEVLDFVYTMGKNWLQSKIVDYFRAQFPKILQPSLSCWINQEEELRN